jgi:hypothetical protein
MHKDVVPVCVLLVSVSIRAIGGEICRRGWDSAVREGCGIIPCVRASSRIHPKSRVVLDPVVPRSLTLCSGKRTGSRTTRLFDQLTWNALDWQLIAQILVRPPHA